MDADFPKVLDTCIHDFITAVRRLQTGFSFCVFHYAVMCSD